MEKVNALPSSNSVTKSVMCDRDIGCTVVT